MSAMKKHYNSSASIIKNKDSTADYSGTINNIIKEEKTGIEKSYISEKYDYKEEIFRSLNKAEKENQYRKRENDNRELQRKNSEYNNKNTYKEQEKKASMYDGEIDLDRVKSYKNIDYKEPTYKTYEKEKGQTPEDIINLKKHDTDFLSKGMENSFIRKKSNDKNMIYSEGRNIDNNKSKITNKKLSSIIKYGKKEGRNGEKTDSKGNLSTEKSLTNRTIQNKYIRSKFAENMEQSDEEFSIGMSKKGVITGERGLKLGVSLGRYSSIKAINIFKKEKLSNRNLRSTILNSTKDEMVNFKGNNSDDLGIKTMVNMKNKSVASKRFITDRKGFIKASINNFELVENQDLGVKSAISIKNSSMMSTRVLKGVYETTKTSVKTGKRAYQVGKRASGKIYYGIKSFGKSISDPLVLKGLITIAIPLVLIILMISAITAIIPSSAAVASYPIAEVEFIKELQDNINNWNEEINNKIQTYYKTYDDVVLVNEDFVIIYLQDVLSILAVETNQNMGIDDLDRAKEIHGLFYSLETTEESYEEIDTRWDNKNGVEMEVVTKKSRIIVDLKTIGIEDVADTLNFDSNSKEWLISLSIADLTEMYPDLVVNNELYYPSLASMSLEEIAKYGGKFIHPTNNIGYISSPFGYRMHPIYETIKLHTGIDIAGNNKKPIYAVNDGIIIYAGVKSGYGNCLMIDHGDGMITLYGHCSTLAVSRGDVVLKGDNIARVGNTGVSTGAHLHFEVRINGKVINPINFLE